MSADLPPGAMAAARRAFPAAAPHALKAALEAGRPFLAAEFLAFTEQAITDRAGEVIGLAVAAERDLLDQAEDTLHSLAMRLLSVSPRLKEPFTDAPELSPWTRTIGPLARRAHDLALVIRKHLGLPHRWASYGLGTPPLEVEDVIAEAVAAERARCAELEQLATEMLASYHKGSDGYRGRVGQVQIGKWRAVLHGREGGGT